MKRDLQSGKESPPIPGPSERTPLSGYPSEAESNAEVGLGDDVLRLMRGFPAESEQDTARWASATRVIVHAIRTFGSEEKAYSWLVSGCGALNNEVPYELLKAGEYKAAGEELDRIDYGVYV